MLQFSLNKNEVKFYVSNAMVIGYGLVYIVEIYNFAGCVLFLQYIYKQDKF